MLRTIDNNMINHNIPLKFSNGFSLLEVMVSSLLISLALLGIMALQLRMGEYSLDAENRSRAFLFAQHVSTELLARNSAVTTPADLTRWQIQLTDITVANPAAGMAIQEGTINVTNPTPDSAEITITWTRRDEDGIGGSGDAGQYITRVIVL